MLREKTGSDSRFNNSHIAFNLNQLTKCKSFNKAKNYKSIQDGRVTKDARFSQDLAEDFNKSEN